MLKPTSMPRLPLLLALVPAFVLSCGIAEAHPGHGKAGGLAQGFLHPFGGLDHVLAMVAVGLLAARLGGRALWLVPLAFLGMMGAGGALGAAGVALPFVESGIALSVVVLGLCVASGLALPKAAAAALAGLFAVFHGYAHGAEMPESAAGLAYGAGFVGASLILHLAGLGLGLALGRAAPDRTLGMARAAGGAMALAGMAMLGGAL